MAESATLEWWAMNFERQVERVREALAALGVDDPVNYTGEVRNFRADALEERVARLERVAAQAEDAARVATALWEGAVEACGELREKNEALERVAEAARRLVGEVLSWDSIAATRELREALVVLDGGDT